MDFVRRSEVRSAKLWGWWLIAALLASGTEYSHATAQAKVTLNEHCAFWMVALESGQTITLPRRLEAGVRYRLFVMGDTQSDDVGVEVVDPLGRLAARDGEVARETLLRFTPSLTGTYSLRLTMHRARGVSLCSVLILPEQGDWHLVQKHWSDALGKVQVLLQILESHGITVEFAARGVWMVGGLVSEGRVVDFGDFAIDSAQPCLWAAVGDSRAHSVQIRLQRDSKDAAQGGGAGKSLALTVSSSQGVYAPRITFRGDAAETFIIVAILPTPSLPASLVKP